MTYERIEIPAYTDRWIMGDRFGDLIRITTRPNGVDIAHIKLDKSGRVSRFILADCRLLD